MKALTGLSVLLAALMLGTSATAQDAYSRPGPYVQAAGNYSWCDFSGSKAPSGDCSAELDGSFGFNVRGGFRFNRFLTAELQIEWMSGFDKKGTIPTGPGVPPGTTEVAVETMAYTINTRFYPFEGRIQPYAIVGLGGLNVWLDANTGSSDSYTSFVGKFGLGVDVYLTRNLALTGEFSYLAATEGQNTYWNWNWTWTDWSGVNPNYMTVSWGLMYRF